MCTLWQRWVYRLGHKSCRKNYTRGQDRCVLACEWYTSVHGLEAVQYHPTETQKRYQFMLSVYITKSVAYHSWHFCNTNLIMVECKHTRYNHVQIMWHQEINFVESLYDDTGLPSAHGPPLHLSCPLVYLFLQLFCSIQVSWNWLTASCFK